MRKLFSVFVMLSILLTLSSCFGGGDKNDASTNKTTKLDDDSGQNDSGNNDSGNNSGGTTISAACVNTSSTSSLPSCVRTDMSYE